MHTLKAYLEGGGTTVLVLILVVTWGEMLAPCPICFTVGETFPSSPIAHWVADWLGPRADLDALSKVY